MSAFLSRLLRYWPGAAFARRGVVYALSFLALAGTGWLVGDSSYLWSATASIWTCLADREGTAAARMRVLGAVGIGGGLVCALGTAVSAMPALALLVVLVGGVIAGLAELQGAAASLCFKLLYVVLIAACLQPPVADVPMLVHAMTASVDYLRGGLFACLVSLLLIPSQRDARPRAQIAAAYEALHRFATALAAPAFPADTMPYKQQIRRRIEAARAAVQARRGWRDPVGMLRYAYAVAVADAIFALLIVVAELRERAGSDHRLPLPHMARCLADIDELVRQNLSQHAPDLPALCAMLAQELRRLRSEHNNAGAPPTYRSALAALGQLPAFAQWRESFAWPRRGLPDAIDQVGLWMTELAARDAQVTRHAVRLALAGGLSLLPAQIWQLGHGYWVAVTVIMVLSPRLQTTRQISFKRFAGSLGGALVACLISLTQPSAPAALGISAMFLAGAYAGRLAGNAAAFAFCLTPAVILFSWTGEPAGASSSVVAALRGIDTALGCLIALASYYVLSPRAELSRAFRHSLDALAVNAVYLRAAIAAARTLAAPTARLEALRVAAGRASTRAEETLAQGAADMSADLAGAHRQIHAAARRMAALAGVVRAGVEAGEAAAPPAEPVQMLLAEVETRLAEVAARPGGSIGKPALPLPEAPGALGEHELFLVEQARFAGAGIDAGHAAVQTMRAAVAALHSPLRSTAIS